jgi:hypothetical protein
MRSARLVIQRDRDLPINTGFQANFDQELADVPSLSLTCDPTPDKVSRPFTVACIVVGYTHLLGGTQRLGGGYAVTYRPQQRCFDASASDRGGRNVVLWFHLERLSTCHNLSANEMKPLPAGVEAASP